MPSLTQMLRLLGNAGAVANVQAVLDERSREQWLVSGLASRLAVLDAHRSATNGGLPASERVA